jgi:rRNA-processing protein FCF1
MKIILDTNFLIDCSKFHIDYQEELSQHTLFVLDATLNELENLINQKKAKHARLALDILKSKPVKVVKTKKDKFVDDLLVETKGYAIATADLELKKRLKGRKLFVIRQKKYIKEI